jgi:7,8-dihydropterin-6-yl-methyl-4-(beta-D-ribofuranosyl)aminobenzene 5'-phosphate synthase
MRPFHEQHRGMMTGLSNAYAALAFSCLLLWAAPSRSEEAPPVLPPRPAAELVINMTLTIVYDNNRFEPRLKPGWGFSCLITGFEKTILFDTGGDGATLLSNMRKLGIDPAQVDVVILSHAHGDHTGGLAAFLEQHSRVVVYLPQSFPESFKNAVRSFGAQVEEVSTAQKLFPGAYTTGELGVGIREQALALKTKEGLVVITGCAHPGIVNMVRKAREITDEERVYLVLGGFHLAAEPPSRVYSIAQQLRQISVRKVAPCHCSGDGPRKVFKEAFGEDYIHSGVGKRVPLPKLE